MVRLFAPRFWGGHLLMVFCVAVAIGLGFWQLHAWQDRREAAAVDLTHAAPVALSSVMGGDDPFPAKGLGQPVTFSGRWLAHGTVYVSDRVHDGRTGYWVVSPMLVDGTRSAIPVVRGWSPRPAAPRATGTADVSGWLQAGEGEGLVDDHPHDDVLPELRIASLVQHVDADLYSGYVMDRTFTADNATADAGLAPVAPAQVPKVSWTTGLRNFLYAIEWWVFGCFALFIWYRWCRDSLFPPEQQPDRSDAEAGSV